MPLRFLLHVERFLVYAAAWPGMLERNSETFHAIPMVIVQDRSLILSCVINSGHRSEYSLHAWYHHIEFMNHCMRIDFGEEGEMSKTSGLFQQITVWAPLGLRQDIN